MKKIAIIGAGGFGREVLMLIEQINQVNKQFEFIGFFDDNLKKGAIINNYPVLGKIEDINSINYDLGVVFAIGSPLIKKQIYLQINNQHIFYPILIHPNVQIGNFVSIGEGSIITAGVIITSNISIGKHVILNLQSTVGHDAKIGDFCSFMPSVNISGEVIIKDLVYIGTGAIIINQKNIGTSAIIGAGAVIIKDVPDGATVVGNPGKVIKIKPVDNE